MKKTMCGKNNKVKVDISPQYASILKKVQREESLSKLELELYDEAVEYCQSLGHDIKNVFENRDEYRDEDYDYEYFVGDDMLVFQGIEEWE